MHSSVVVLPEQYAWLARQRNAVLAAMMAEINKEPPMCARMCNCLLGPMARVAITAFSSNHCITATVSRYKRDQLAEFVLTDCAVPVPRDAQVAHKADMARLGCSSSEGGSGKGLGVPCTMWLQSALQGRSEPACTRSGRD